MIRTACLATCLALGATSVSAEPLVKALAFHNVHIRVSDPAKAGEWYVKHLGAKPGRAPQLVYFGNTLIEFVKTEKLLPSTGSVIDHIGLSYPDLATLLKELETAGAKVVTPLREAPGLFKLAFVEDPWGAKIELVEDAELTGFHHVHLRVPDPARTLQWYEDMLGGDRGKLKGRIEGIRYGPVWLLAASSGAERPAPSLDRAIYNVAWLVPNVDEAVAAFESRGVKTRVSPRSIGTVRYAFVEDPDGVQIEFIHVQP